MRLIYGWRVTTSWVRRPLWVNQPANSASYTQWDGEWVVYRLARWVKLLAAVLPSSECLYEGKADVMYLQVTNSVWSTSERLVVEILTIGAIQVRFLSTFLSNWSWTFEIFSTQTTTRAFEIGVYGWCLFNSCVVQKKFWHSSQMHGFIPSSRCKCTLGWLIKSCSTIKYK